MQVFLAVFCVVFHDITLWIKFISNDVCVRDVQTLLRGSRGEECSVELEVHNKYRHNFHNQKDQITKSKTKWMG